MSGKRIAREKLTIKKMIALYESQCPQASNEQRSLRCAVCLCAKAAG
ncbi:Uncharacterised protein [Citrobacter koseri]|uniref:Nitrous oxide-stimulated promoter n=1 Tax=Citrobacter koseri TaxID=545 RepID=A0A2X2WG33_CITKO|nr:Uncharacterised protein [Citrobacter koseri]